MKTRLYAGYWDVKKLSTDFWYGQFSATDRKTLNLLILEYADSRALDEITFERDKLLVDNELLHAAIEQLELELENVKDAIRGCPYRETRCAL